MPAADITIITPATDEAYDTNCASCESGLCLTINHTHPGTRVPGNATALYFCTALCVATWRRKHCAWCGAAPNLQATQPTLVLTVKVTGSVSDRRYCKVDCLQKHQKALETVVARANKQ